MRLKHTVVPVRYTLDLQCAEDSLIVRSTAEMIVLL